MKRVLLLNTKAGRGKKRIEAIRNHALELGIKKSNIHVVKNPEYLNRHLRKVLDQDPDILYIGGGDGTIIRTIDYCRNNAFMGAYAIIPLGTSNYVARNLKIELNPLKSLDLEEKTPKRVYFAECNEQLFSLFASVGAVSRIAEKVTVGDKQRFGQVAYIHTAMRQIRRQRSFIYKMTIDGETYEGETLQIMINNANLAEQIPLSPNSSLSTDRLKVVLYETKKPWMLLVMLAIYILTLGTREVGMRVYDTDEVLIETEQPEPVNLDGEKGPTTPVQIKILKKPIRIYC